MSQKRSLVKCSLTVHEICLSWMLKAVYKIRWLKENTCVSNLHTDVQKYISQTYENRINPTELLRILAIMCSSQPVLFYYNCVQRKSYEQVSVTTMRSHEYMTWLTGRFAHNREERNSYPILTTYFVRDFNMYTLCYNSGKRDNIEISQHLTLDNLKMNHLGTLITSNIVCTANISQFFLHKCY